MCGIVGYIGKKEAFPILIKGLKRLEYRGYDSSGIGIISDDLFVYKQKGKIKNLEDFTKNKKTKGNLGIGHTRWATHGIPSNENAHPHFSQSKNIIVVHNGIIENYLELKKKLVSLGHTFLSDTDSEVLAHLIEEIQNKEKKKLFESTRLALTQVVGAYAIALISKNEPDKIIVARKGSPLVIGVNKNEFFVASDATPIIEHTKEVIYLENEGIASLGQNGQIIIKNTKNIKKTPFINKLEMDLEDIEKGGYDTFMQKEIFEQPKSIADTLRGRVDIKNNKISLGGIINIEKELKKVKRLIILGCGTSYHSGLIGKYYFEEISKVQANVEYASEFRYRNPVLEKGDMVIAISQSGETADTNAAVELALKNNIPVLGVCNVVGSTLSRITKSGIYMHAGPEIGVASTKAFTSQVLILLLLAIKLREIKGEKVENKKKILLEINNLPSYIEKILKKEEEIKKIAEHYKNSKNCLYLGRGYNFPVALEGALKIKEISYMHAEGYPAAEIKHGIIALVDKDMPAVVIATENKNFEKVVNNIEEIKSRNGKIIIITTDNKEIPNKLYDHIIRIPKTLDIILPILSIIPLQILAYNVARLRGLNVDQPRNLAKSVTVE